MNRRLNDAEYRLARWMLEHGTPQALEYLEQLELAEVTPWRCECGCASIDLSIPGQPKPECGMKLLGDCLIGDGDQGIFIYECQGVLSGIEVYGCLGGAPKSLPTPEDLRQREAGVEQAMRYSLRTLVIVFIPGLGLGDDTLRF